MPIAADSWDCSIAPLILPDPRKGLLSFGVGWGLRWGLWGGGPDLCEPSVTVLSRCASRYAKLYGRLLIALVSYVSKPVLIHSKVIMQLVGSRINLFLPQ